MKHLIILLTIFSFFTLDAKQSKKNLPLVISTKKIHLDAFPDAWNPSIVKTDYGFLMTFRHCLMPLYPWISYIGIVMLDEDLNPISSPQLLNTREDGALTPSQAEDARIFNFNNKTYLIYNDNQEDINPSQHLRRDIFIAELVKTNDEFTLLKPLKLTHEKKYDKVNWQKNWVPFEYENKLLMAYAINSHEILEPEFQTGISRVINHTSIKNKWSFGALRGGTPALLVDGEYVAFFHSSKVTASKASSNQAMHHYYMGAYTFSAKPPFVIKKISESPIIGDNFYTQSSYGKRVIFPGGFTVFDNYFYVAYGKDDSEIWIAKIDKENLMKSLKKTKRR